LLCLGLDPEVGKIFGDKPVDLKNLEWLYAWCKEIVEKTKDVICCVKPNSAFFEQFGAPGVAVLQRVVREIPDGLPVLLDVKRGDIGSTATAYAKSAFEMMGADAVTLSPYLGKDSIDPFLAYQGKTAFLLCQTSNPSAGEIQNFGNDPLYQHVARIALSWGNPDQIAFVVGATKPEALIAVREIAPQSWLLAPGVGAQGGDLETALAAGLRTDGSGMIIPVSRSILYASDPRKAAMELKEQIHAIRMKVKSTPRNVSDAHTKLVVELFNAECVRFGDFTLASGKKSPIYVDLRRVISYPNLMKLVVTAYLQKISGISCDLLAAVPYAALPAAANIAFSSQKPMIYPRKEAKTHGTGKMVEGNFKSGQKALVIEDVITTGGSILTAIETLQNEGIVVKDVVVLVDRQQGGDEALAKAGFELHPILTIRQIMEILLKEKCIDQTLHATVLKYLDEDHAS
jgi:uridine monophosphate synthetase